MTLAASLIAAAFPALLIERWTAKDGWPVFRVFVALPDHRIPLGQNFEHFAARYAERVADTRILQGARNDRRCVHRTISPTGWGPHRRRVNVARALTLHDLIVYFRGLTSGFALGPITAQ